jgi:hypothetical protein
MAIVIYRNPDQSEYVRVMLIEERRSIKKTINTLFTGYFNYVSKAYYIYLNKASREVLRIIYANICSNLAMTRRLEFYRIPDIVALLYEIQKRYPVLISTEMLDAAEPDRTRTFINALREKNIWSVDNYTAHPKYGSRELPANYQDQFPDFEWSQVAVRHFDQRYA